MLRSWQIFATLFLIAGGCLLRNATWQERRLERGIEERVTAVDRIVDFGIVLKTVVADPNGQELVAGKPKLRVIREHHLGGLVDTHATPPAFIGHSRNPVIWYCSEDQEAILLHDDPAVSGQLVYGSEGAGKTTTLAMWHAIQVLRHIGQGREGGQTAPTEARLDLVIQEMINWFPANWYTHKKADGLFVFADGSRIRFLSTHRQSQAEGSRIQGYNWSWVGWDEGQDQVDDYPNVLSRLRAAEGGAKRAPKLMTATAKDDSAWRDLRDQIDVSPLWVRRTLLGTRSPFVDPGHWEALKGGTSARDYARRAGAEDLGPEHRVYPAFDRQHSVVTIQEIGWEDVTQAELARWGGPFSILVGHDPGSLHDVSLILKAYKTHKAKRPFWVVLDEITTDETTTEQHLAKLLPRVQDRFKANLLDRKGQPTGPQMFVRSDPATKRPSLTSSQPDKAVYTIFRNHKIRIEPAAYSVNGGTGHGQVPKDAGIEMVNTLFCAESGERRLFIARNTDGTPAAPKLVKALEMAQRDEQGRAEAERKDKYDLSHWPAALRYALWAIERPRLQAIAGGIA